jgi:hypothetical protein
VTCGLVAAYGYQDSYFDRHKPEPDNDRWREVDDEVTKAVEGLGRLPRITPHMSVPLTKASASSLRIRSVGPGHTRATRLGRSRWEQTTPRWANRRWIVFPDSAVLFPS